MDKHVEDYYLNPLGKGMLGQFHKTIALNEALDLDWETVHKMAPNLPKGWYELSCLSLKDRIEFTQDFWQSKLPFRHHFFQFIDHFFSSLDDIGIFLTQKNYDAPFQVEMVYSLKDNRGFYRGKPPITEMNLSHLKKDFSSINLPTDYIAFLQIHDGFCKATDCTGITASCDMKGSYDYFQKMMERDEPLTTGKGSLVNPKSLIPFYESFGMPFYQCFFSEWYPEQEMGNVYYSAESHTISELSKRGSNSLEMTFTAFLDWLKFYLESVT